MKRSLTALLAVPALVIAAFGTAGPVFAADANSITTPAALLEELVVAVPSTIKYERALFAEGLDVDNNGCNTRREVLLAESLVPVTRTGVCDILAGQWFSWYDGATYTDPVFLEMDHLVALKEAWISGAWAWTNQQRSDYANDLGIDETLTAVAGAVNNAKGAYDPAQWIPSHAPSLCKYASDWITVKYRWNLSVDSAEKSALQALVAGHCGTSTIAIPPVRTDTARTLSSMGGVNPLPAGTHRLQGDDRYATAVAISSRFNPGVAAVYVATGTNYPDALSASALAGAKSSPLLLVTPTAIPDLVWAELQRLAPQSIVIVGGEAVVSPTVEQRLSTLATVTRAAGENRYETSRVLAETSGLPPSDIAYLSTGRDFPDALSASGAAGTISAPVVLIDGGAAVASADTIQTLGAVGATTVRLVGGTGVISTGHENSLRSQVAVVQRYAGDDRYSTGVHVNRSVFDTASTVYLAVGSGFADALAGSALAGATSSPLFIVSSNCIPSVVKTEINRLAPTTVVLLGGTGVLGEGVAALRECGATPPGGGGGGGGVPANPGDSVNCGDFATWRAAQDWFERYYPYYGDIAKLDGNNDRVACESLPGAPRR